jgi:uncharacterized protein (TIGR03083 family)
VSSEATEEPVIGLLEHEWASIVALGATLDEDRWSMQTDCPGWTAKDNVSHLVGIENMLRGAPADPPVDERPAHVTNDFGAFNEAAVEARRDRSGADVLDEFRAVTAERLAALRALPAAKWDEIGPTPTGEDTYRHFMRMRVFDSWVHEQDIRRAVGAPGHLTGPVVDLVLEWHRRNLGYIVGRRAGVADRTAVAFDLGTERTVVAVEGKRARVLDAVDAEAADPAVTLQLDVEAFNALLAGRWTADHAITRGRLAFAGDAALGHQVASAMGYLF